MHILEKKRAQNQNTFDGEENPLLMPCAVTRGSIMKAPRSICRGRVDGKIKEGSDSAGEQPRVRGHG